MRLRNVKNKQEILDSSKLLVLDYKKNKGKWSKVFNNSNPIYIEIGMGKGDFILENARTYPDINFIDIEKYDSVIAKALQKIPDNISNLYIGCYEKPSDELLNKFKNNPKVKYFFTKGIFDICQ